MSFEEFQEGGHLGYQKKKKKKKKKILAILNLYVAPMPPIVLAQSDLRFGMKCPLENFKMATVAILAILNLYVAPMPPIKF